MTKGWLFFCPCCVRWRTAVQHNVSPFIWMGFGPWKVRLSSIIHWFTLVCSCRCRLRNTFGFVNTTSLVNVLYKGLQPITADVHPASYRSVRKCRHPRDRSTGRPSCKAVPLAGLLAKRLTNTFISYILAEAGYENNETPRGQRHNCGSRPPSLLSHNIRTRHILSATRREGTSHQNVALRIRLSIFNPPDVICAAISRLLRWTLCLW